MSKVPVHTDWVSVAEKCSAIERFARAIHAECYEETWGELNLVEKAFWIQVATRLMDKFRIEGK
jgi:hypothetical protein